MAYSRLSARLKKSSLVQWAVSLSTGGGFASSIHYLNELVLSLISTAENVKTGLTIANHTISGVIFFIGTTLAQNEIFKGITSTHHLDEKFKNSAIILTQNEVVVDQNHTYLLKMVELLQEFVHASNLNPKLNREITVLTEKIKTLNPYINTDENKALNNNFANEVNDEKFLAEAVFIDSNEEKIKTSHHIPTRFERILDSLRTSSRSTTAQYIASIGTGASIASALDYIANKMFNEFLAEGKLQISLNIGTHIGAGVLFLCSAVIARRNIYQTLTTNHNLGSRFSELKEKTDTNLLSIEKTHAFLQDIAELLVNIGKELCLDIPSKLTIQELQEEINRSGDFTLGEEKEEKNLTQGYYKRFSLWVKNKSQSSPAQWIASIGNGANFSSGVHYCFEQIIGLIDPNSYSLKVANYVASTVIFIIGTAITRSEIYRGVTTTRELSEKSVNLHQSLDKSNLITQKQNSLIKDISELLGEITARDNTLQDRIKKKLNTEICRIVDEFEFIEMRIHDNHSSHETSIMGSQISSDSIELVTFHNEHKEPFLRKSSISLSNST